MNNITKTKSTYHVTLAEAKKHQNIETSFTDDDVYITQLIKESTSDVENYINSDLAETANVFEMYDFSGSIITVFESPLIAVQSITYLDDNEDSQTIIVADQLIQKGMQKFKIVLDDILTTVQLTINFTTGYTSGLAPEWSKRAVLMRLADYYDVARGSFVSKAFNDSGLFERSLAPHQNKSF